mgnify:CR=1 FL=1
MNYIKYHLCKILRKYKTKDPYNLVSKMNIEIIKHNLDPKIRGLTVYDSKEKIHKIGLNTNLSYIMEKFVLTHELGHILLHPDSGRYFLEKNTLFLPDKFEIQANKFAASLLIDKNELINLLKIENDLNRIAFELEVPEELVKLKIEDSNIFF